MAREYLAWHDAYFLELADRMRKAIRATNPEAVLFVNHSANRTWYYPEAYMGEVNRDLNGRRGRVLGMDTSDGMQVITAQVPQAEWAAAVQREPPRETWRSASMPGTLIVRRTAFDLVGPYDTSLRAGESLEGLVPRAVADYISKQELYTKQRDE